MINFGDTQYVSYIQMGKQMIAGIFDTGSYELVVFGSGCSTCGVAAHYNSRLSKTAHDGKLETQQQYRSGETSSQECYDQVSIGPYPAVEQMFWNVVDARMPILANAAFEAIIGIGPPEAPLAQIWNETGNLVNNLTSYYENGEDAPADVATEAKEMIDVALTMSKSLPMLSTLGVPQFSVCLGAKPGTDGLFIWNDTMAMEHPDMFTKVPVVGTHSWSANMSNVQLVSRFADPTDLGCAGGCSAVLDTGTSLIAAPAEVIDKVQAAMAAVDENCSNLHVLPDLVFELGGWQFSLPPSAYVAEVIGEVPENLGLMTPHLVQSERSCSLSLINSGDDNWILGVPFFRKYYTTFSLGTAMEERCFYIAPHPEDECTPGAPSVSMSLSKQQLSRVEAKRLHLPSRGGQRRMSLRK